MTKTEPPKLSGCRLDEVVFGDIHLNSNPLDDTQVSLSVDFLLMGGERGPLESPPLVVEGKQVMWPQDVKQQAVKLLAEVRKHIQKIYFVGGDRAKRAVKDDPLGIVRKTKLEDTQLRKENQAEG